MTLDKDIWKSVRQHSASLIDGSRAIAPPKDLLDAVRKVRARYGEGQARLVTQDRVGKLVDELKRSPRDLRRGERFILAHALSQYVPSLDGRSLLLQEQLSRPMFVAWEQDCKLGRLAASHWRGLFHSYLQSEPCRGMERLRQLLKASLAQVGEKYRSRPAWLATAERHVGLLSERPCDPYVSELLEGKRAYLDDLLSGVSVPKTSWLWPAILDAVLKQLDAMDDSRFRSRIQTALSLPEHLPLARDMVLARVLDRYERTRDRNRHESLLTFALAAWKSPQLSRNTLWGLVRPATKQMVCGWLAQEDLEDFYRLCQGEKQIDDRRLKYWLRFKDQIVFSQIILGAGLQGSRDPDIRDFRMRKKDRLARLTSGTSNNNAILMQINNWVFVEFSEKGNACYPYRLEYLPFELGDAAYSIDGLKDRVAVEKAKGRKLNHLPSDRWEAEFDDQLRKWGIRTDEPATCAASRVGSKPHRTASGTVKPASNGPQLVHLLEQIRKDGGDVSDRRGYGGYLSVRPRRFDKVIDRDLRKLGFEWSKAAGYYLE